MKDLFGYKPDPSEGKSPDGTTFDWVEKDLSYRAGLFKPVHQGDVDLSAHCTETDQLNLSSCVGNSTADSIEILNSLEGNPKIQVSRLFIYACARMLQDDDGDGKNDLNLDHGTYIRLAFDVLSRFGVCEEALCPYDVTKVFSSPSLKAMRQATGHRIHSYYRIKSTGDDRLEEVLSALRANHPVVFGTNIDSAFQSLHDETPVGVPARDIIGAHAMILVGYRDGNFLVKNSWGHRWGAGGFWLMRPEYLTWSGTQDLWVPTLGTRFSS